MYVRSRSSWIKHIDFMLVDLLCLNVSYFLAVLLRFSSGSGEYLTSGPYQNLVIVINVLEIAACLMCSNLSEVLLRGKVSELEHVIALALITFALTACYMYVAHTSGAYSRLLIFYTFLLFVVLDYLARRVYKAILLRHLEKTAKSDVNRKPVFLVTESEYISEITKELESGLFARYTVTGVCVLNSSDVTIISELDWESMDLFSDKIVFTDINDAAKYICREWIDEVFLYAPDSTFLPKSFIDQCKMMGIALHIRLDLENVEHGKQFIENLGNRTVLTTVYNYISPWQAFIKRAMDIVGGIIGSLFAILIGLVIGPIIYISSPGPILFKQRRIGQNGKPFWVYKFRSMYLDAEERKQSLMNENRITDGMMFKLDFDPRVIGNRILPDGTKKTGIGEFIRKTSLDEFPQFFNVLMGDMSLVGTRPPTVDEWEKYEYHHRARLAIRPGITGLWQISGRSEITDFEEVVHLDTEYITHYRTSLDIVILLKTIIVLFQRKGAM